MRFAGQVLFVTVARSGTLVMDWANTLLSACAPRYRAAGRDDG